jgi:hypothetical protein
MDLYSELKENKQQFENNKISEDEYNKRQKSILNKWPGKLKNHSHGKNKKKQVNPVILHQRLFFSMQ